MGIRSKLRTVFRGDVPIFRLPHEALRRRKASARQRAERDALDRLNETPARLLAEFAERSPAQLVAHFQSAERPSYQHPANSSAADANAIVENSTWPLMGFGPMRFDGDDLWRRDPISGHDWGLEYHADLVLARGDGSDVRVLWELNRLGHLLALASAYDQIIDEKYAETFFSHIEAWNRQNPYARGANWGCAMEVALRACNVLAAFQAFRRSTSLTAARLDSILKFFDHHGRFIVDNNEFSYIATSNHYLSDVVGLFWIGLLLPELQHAGEWKDFGLRELLREMDKQVLPDGADFEASTGYHRFVTEMIFHTFRLAEQNDIPVPQRYKDVLRRMLEYQSAITRPDGKMPLVGDCDGSRFLPVTFQSADASGFLLDIAKVPYINESRAFPDAGIYVMRGGDLYLHFNGSDSGLNGRGSHAHNDALSIEVFAHGRAFIVDPGSYAYNLDLDARHLFRSTAYHSTVTVDGVEQNTISRELPFITGNEAAPRVRELVVDNAYEMVRAEQYGYEGLSAPVIHARCVEFDKTEGTWTVTDEFSGRGQHRLVFNFHLSPGVDANLSKIAVDLFDEEGNMLRMTAHGIAADPVLHDSFFAPNYGERLPTKTLTWEVNVDMPFKASFSLVPLTDTPSSTN